MNVAESSTTKSSPKWPLLITLGLVSAVGLLYALTRGEDVEIPVAGGNASKRHGTDRNAKYGKLTIWWDKVPFSVQAQSAPPSTTSNIHVDDYIGPDACKECHKKNYELWSEHPHRWMNAEATEQAVLGDFSDRTISYLGGIARFTRSGDRYQMSLDRDNVSRVYDISQTIGSRFYQYYVGKMTSGPETGDHKFRTEEHVLPFGYWLERKEWVPVVHLGHEHPDGKRADPFSPPTDGHWFSIYSNSCNYCHTTFALGDMFSRRDKLGLHAPLSMNWSMFDYLSDERPSLLSGKQHSTEFSQDEVGQLTQTLHDLDASEHAITMGISCEACHLGCKEHAQDPKTLPEFFPRSPYLYVESREPPATGRSHMNVNWACGRCHAGGRTTYANGVSTWNSTEYSDAMRGSCYSQLRCVDCHNPHKPIGKKWTRPPKVDDASCIRCHQQYEEPDAIAAHTHHAPESAGSHCMNCHMPKINEGMQDAVRTHTVFSPTDPEMIHQNHPNACNLCHLDKGIDWTVSHLSQWYGKSYASEALTANYSDRKASVGLGWLKSDSEAVRLIAVAALADTNSKWAIRDLVEMLDDPYLLNRQFTQSGLEKLLQSNLSEYGYRHYQTADERRDPIRRIMEAVNSRE